ncbi:MAG: AraC family transcriptional regulator [Bacteroidota bacterium]
MIFNSALHPFVRKVWVMENTSGSSRTTGALVGDGNFELAFIHGPGYKTIRDNITELFSSGIYLGGQLNAPLRLEILPETTIIFVKLSPWAMSVLTGFNLSDGLNETIPLKELNLPLFNKLKDYHPLFQTDDLLSVINQELDDAQHGAKRNWQLLQKCCSILNSGYIDFKAAKDLYLKDIGLSARTIETSFSKGIGLTPQQYTIGIRFRKFMDEYEFGTDESSLTSLAYKHGYFDQAHLNRTFKQYWGFSPKKLQSESLFITDERETFRYYTI